MRKNKLVFRPLRIRYIINLLEKGFLKVLVREDGRLIPYLTKKVKDDFYNYIIKIWNEEVEEKFNREGLDKIESAYSGNLKLIKDRYLDLLKEFEKNVDWHYYSIRNNEDILKPLFTNEMSINEAGLFIKEEFDYERIQKTFEFKNFVNNEVAVRKFEYIRDELCKLNEDADSILIHLTTNKITEKILLIYEFGIIDFLDKRYNLDGNYNKIANMLAPIIDEKPVTIKSYISSLKQPISNKNNPLTESNKIAITNILTSLKLPIKEIK